MAAIPRRELQLLGAAIALGLIVRVVYVLVTWDHTLVGDEPEYHQEAAFLLGERALIEGRGVDPRGRAPGWPPSPGASSSCSSAR